MLQAERFLILHNVSINWQVLKNMSHKRNQFETINIRRTLIVRPYVERLVK